MIRNQELIQIRYKLHRKRTGNARVYVFFSLLPSILLSTSCQRDTRCCLLFHFHLLQSACVIALCGGIGCQIQSRVERASFLEFVEGTRKASVRSGKGEPLSHFQLCHLARKRGQAGRIEFFWKKSIHLSAHEHGTFFESFLEGIRASKENICIYIQLFLRCILIPKLRSVERGKMIYSIDICYMCRYTFWPRAFIGTYLMALDLVACGRRGTGIAVGESRAGRDIDIF